MTRRAKKRPIGLQLKFGDEDPIIIPVTDRGTDLVEVAPGQFAHSIGRDPDPDADWYSRLEVDRREFWLRFAAQESEERIKAASSTANEAKQQKARERDALICRLAELCLTRPPRNRCAAVEDIFYKGGLSISTKTIRRVLERIQPALLKIPQQSGRWGANDETRVLREIAEFRKKSGEVEKK